MQNKYLTLLQNEGLNGNKNKTYLCRCNVCGKEIRIWASHFYRGDRGCDCWKIGKQNPRLYSIWANMKTRCYNSNTPNYDGYGAKGIKICDEWMVFEIFLEWAKTHGYDNSLTIDRIDNDKGYCPENCRWATIVQQANNKTNNIIIDLDGTPKSLKRYCEDHGLIYKTEHTYLSRHGYEAELQRLKEKLEKN